MRTRASLTSLVLATLASLSAAPSARAWEKTTQAHLRAGLLSLSYSTPNGGVSGSHSIATTLDAELELFSSPRASYLLRGVFGLDVAQGRLPYSYVGTGRRYYLFTSGLAQEHEDEVARVASIPKWRFYAGGELGVSQLEVQRLGSIYQVNSVLLELGAQAGTIFQLTRAIGLEVQAAYGWGYGLSSVSVRSSGLKGFVGASFSF
jgi:hypothetical protein